MRCHPFIPILLLAVLGSGALAASPDLQGVAPRGAQRGTEADLVFSGSRLADANGALFYSPGITVTHVGPCDAQHARMHVRISKDAAVGICPMRLRTATGLSELRTFCVTAYPVVPEKEPNNDLANAQPAGLNTTIDGVIENEDVDTFAVHAKKGRRLSAEVMGMRLGDAMFDPYVAILNEKRFALAACDDTAFARQDPIASIIVPADGTYFVQVRDASYNGGANFHYLLSIGSFPRPTIVFPLGGKAGEKLSVKFIGDVAGDFTQPITLPDHPMDEWKVLAEQDGLVSPSPNSVRVSSFTNVLEQGPNHDPAHATPVEQDVPVALNGILAKSGEIDYFKFKAHKGRAIEIRVLARALRSPLDSVIFVVDEHGRQIAANDDSGGPDSYLRLNPPADGQYVLGIFDQLRHGGPDYAYRIELTPVKPACTLQIPQYAINSQERNWVVVPRGNRFAQLFRASRSDFGGELTLSCADLPTGVTMDCQNMADNSDLVPVVFEAAADAPVAGKLCELTAHVPGGKTDVTGEYRQPVEMVIGNNNRIMDSIELSKLCVAVADPAPFNLRIVQPKVPIVQGGQMNLRVIAQRSGNFKGPISVRMLFNPPGIGSTPAVDMPAGKNEIDYPISASDGAPIHTWKICVLGTADVNGPMWVSSGLADLNVSEPFIHMRIDMAAAEQGKPCSVLCHVDPVKKFDGSAQVKLLGLPPGAAAPDLQLGGNDKQLVFNVTTSPTTPVGQHGTLLCQVTVMQNGEPIVDDLARGGMLRVDPPPRLRKGAAPKPVVARARPDSVKPLSRLDKLRLEAGESKQ